LSQLAAVARFEMLADFNNMLTVHELFAGLYDVERHPDERVQALTA
jgi:hypothetical protein